MSQDVATVGGRAAMIVALTLAASALPMLRIPVGGSMVHPYLIPLLLVLVPAIGRIERMPREVLGFMFLAGALYLMAVSVDRTFVGETMKMLASAFTLVTMSILLSTRRDFVIACGGFAAAVALISIKGLLGATVAGEGINPFQGLANKNAFSLFGLPALLLSGSLILDARLGKRTRGFHIVCSTVTVIALFSTANRSGWLGVLLIGAMLGMRGRSLRGLVLVGVLAAASYFLVVRFGDPDLIESKLTQTQTGYKSDTKRQELFLDALDVGLNHPFLGVGHDTLTRSIGRRSIERPIETHNVLAHLIGATGFLTTFAFAGLGWALWRRNRVRMSSEQSSAKGLVRMMLLLWLVRGMFTHEILYSPGFAMGIGLAFGLCIVEGEYDPPRRPAAVRPPAAAGAR